MHGNINGGVLLVYANPVLQPAATPYGLNIIESLLQEKGIETTILCPFLYQNPILKLHEVFESLRPRIVGFSFRNLDGAGLSHEDDNDFTFVSHLRQLIDEIKFSDSVIVLGGSGFSIAPSEIMQVVNADVGFIGNSEIEFIKFCERMIVLNLSFNEAIKDLNNIILKGIQTPRKISFPLSIGKNCVFTQEMVEFAKLEGGTIPIRLKTGCPLACSYCVVPNIEYFQLRNWKDIEDEFNFTIQNGLGDRIFIADSEFNLPDVEYAKKICRRLIKIFNNKISWHCYLDAGTIDSQLLKLMKEAGCKLVRLNVDSFYKSVRKGFNKNSDPKRIKANVILCINSGIFTQVNILFGGPNETFDTIEQTALISSDLNKLGADLNISIGLRVYKNTLLHSKAISQPYRKHYSVSGTFNWLGTFCSPATPTEIFKFVVNYLPASDSIRYTSSVKEPESLLVRVCAIGALLLASKNYIKAKEHFIKALELFPEDDSIRLGLLKAEKGLLTSID